MTRAQLSIDRSHHNVFICRQVEGASPNSYSCISSETSETDWEEEGGSRAHHVPLVLLLLSSPFPLFSSFFFFPLLVSPSVLRLRRKCAVSSCTSSVLSSLHVNKHPKYIIGTEPHVHAAQRTADGHVTPDKPHQGDTDVPSTFLNYCQLQPPPCTHRRRCGSKHGQ